MGGERSAALEAEPEVGKTWRTGSRMHSRLSRWQVPHMGNVFSKHFFRLKSKSETNVRGEEHWQVKSISLTCSDTSNSRSYHASNPSVS